MKTKKHFNIHILFVRLLVGAIIAYFTEQPTYKEVKCYDGYHNEILNTICKEINSIFGFITNLCLLLVLFVFFAIAGVFISVDKYSDVWWDYE
jgi:hypothetical protein